MIRIEVDEESLRTVRLTFSPLWETIGSLGILARYRGEAPTPYAHWARVVRRGLSADLAQELVEAMRRPDPPLFPPGFIPVPDPSRNSFAAELDHLRRIHERTPRTDRLIGLLQRYWDGAIAPFWTDIRTSVEEEILFRGRTLAVDGPEAMLGELGGRVSWSRPHLTAPYHRDLQVSVTRSQLLLVPTVFAGGLRLFMAEGGRTAMSYQARATGQFHVLTAQARDKDTEDRLALLLGKGRAQVVRAVELPKTTTAIADELGLAKSTVSQHLTVLTGTGIVRKQRLGGRVLYQLDDPGLSLLRQLGP